MNDIKIYTIYQYSARNDHIVQKYRKLWKCPTVPDHSVLKCLVINTKRSYQALM